MELTVSKTLTLTMALGLVIAMLIVVGEGRQVVEGEETAQEIGINLTNNTAIKLEKEIDFPIAKINSTSENEINPFVVVLQKIMLDECKKSLQSCKSDLSLSQLACTFYEPGFFKLMKFGLLMMLGLYGVVVVVTGVAALLFGLIVMIALEYVFLVVPSTIIDYVGSFFA